MRLIENNNEFRQFIHSVGPWFDGMAKFIRIMASHNNDIYTGERFMLQKLERETFKIDKYMKELRNRFKAEDDELVTEIVRTVQERLLADERVGDVLAMPAADFWQLLLTDEERQSLNGLLDSNLLIDHCLYEPFRSLFGLSGSVHRLYSLNDDWLAARLFVAAVNDGTVSVIVGESVTPIVMDVITARMVDAFSLAELVDTGVSLIVDIGVFQIEFGKVSYPGEQS